MLQSIFAKEGFQIRLIPPKPSPWGGRWAGEAGSDEGAIWYPTFPCRKKALSQLSPQRGFSIAPLATRSPPHPSPSVTASPQGEASGLCSPTRKSAPNQGTYMGTVIAPPPGQCATTAKTSEWERAGHKKRGSRGQSPRRSFLRLSPEKAGLPPGVGRETTPQVWTCAGPAGTPCRRHPPVGQNSILCLQGRIPCAMITENMAILYKRNPAGGPPADKGSILWKSMVWRSNSTCDTAK